MQFGALSGLGFIYSYIVLGVIVGLYSGSAQSNVKARRPEVLKDWEFKIGGDEEEEGGGKKKKKK